MATNQPSRDRKGAVASGPRSLLSSTTQPYLVPTRPGQGLVQPFSLAQQPAFAVRAGKQGVGLLFFGLAAGAGVAVGEEAGFEAGETAQVPLRVDDLAHEPAENPPHTGWRSNLNEISRRFIKWQQQHNGRRTEKTPINPPVPALRKANNAPRKTASKHGLLARDAVMAGEDPAEFDRQLQELEHTLFPKNALEFELVRQVADAQWRLRRISRIEAGLLTHHCDGTTRDAKRWCPETILPGRDGENQLLGKSMQDRTQALANLARYNSHLNRNMLRAVNLIWQLRADEARCGEDRTGNGAIHRPIATDPDPYNQPDPLEPQPERYAPPAAVAQTPRRPIGFRPNAVASAQATSSEDLISATRDFSGSVYPVPSSVTGPSTPGRVAGTRRTQSRRSYLESMGWSAYEPLRPKHESRNTIHSRGPRPQPCRGGTHREVGVTQQHNNTAEEDANVRQYTPSALKVRPSCGGADAYVPHRHF